MWRAPGSAKRLLNLGKFAQLELRILLTKQGINTFVSFFGGLLGEGWTLKNTSKRVLQTNLRDPNRSKLQCRGQGTAHSLDGPWKWAWQSDGRQRPRATRPTDPRWKSQSPWTKAARIFFFSEKVVPVYSSVLKTSGDLFFQLGFQLKFQFEQAKRRCWQVCAINLHDELCCVKKSQATWVPQKWARMILGRSNNIATLWTPISTCLAFFFPTSKITANTDRLPTPSEIQDSETWPTLRAVEIFRCSFAASVAVGVCAFSSLSGSSTYWKSKSSWKSLNVSAETKTGSNVLKS